MLIDSHCHLPHTSYTKTTKQLIKEAGESGVGKLICVGTSLAENLKSLKVAEAFENVYTTVGVYPHEDITEDLKVVITELEAQIKLSPKIVGIGETGLDISNWTGGRPLDQQIALFEAHIQLAIKYKLPLVLHNRNADIQVLELLTKYRSQGLTGVAHSFSQDWEFAKKMLDLNFFLSFSAMITYPTRDLLREVVAQVPEDRFLVETDSPYLSPQGMRGQVNEPKNVTFVADKVAELRGISFAKVEELTYSSTCALFL